jgi:ABC-type branched-subunit amino acid transport system ATPase component
MKGGPSGIGSMLAEFEGVSGAAGSSGLRVAPDADPILQIRGLRRSFGGIDAVAGLDLDVHRGRIAGLIGPNGAGKTTAIDLVSGVRLPTAGQVLLGGTDVTGAPAHRLARLGLTRTFQICRDLGSLTVLENCLVARPRQSGERLADVFFRGARVRRGEASAIEAARDVLTQVDLWRLADAPASTLSGGQKKLLEICRALMADPRVVLLDEPAAGVAPPMEDILINAIRRMAERGIAVVIVEHDLDVVAALSDVVHVMAGGRILVSGRFDEVTADDRVLEAYLGVRR